MTPNDSNTPAANAAPLRQIKLMAIAVALLMVAGIVGLMILSAGEGEDITGIVAPALLVTMVSGVVAAVAGFLQKRAQQGGGDKGDSRR